MTTAYMYMTHINEQQQQKKQQQNRVGRSMAGIEGMSPTLL